MSAELEELTRAAAELNPIQLRVLLNFDTLYIGGGDAQLIDFEVASDVRIVSNDAGITGGKFSTLGGW